jgi:hypothetical protein
MHNTRITPLKTHLLNNKGRNVPTHSLFFTSDSKTYAPKTILNRSSMLLPSVNVNVTRNSFHHKENEILPTIEWKPSFAIDSTHRETGEPEKIGFIILRHVNSSITNEYWKECYRCIKTFYPKNRILIIDDNSNKTFLTHDPLDNTMIIQSEFPRRGEFLPYYYYLKTKFCETAVILHDSVFIKKYIDFHVNNYKMILNFCKKNISDRESLPYQMTLLSAINNEKLNNFYNKKDLDLWSGCFGCMSVIKYDYLKSIDSEFRIACLIPHITCRMARCAFERIIGCLLQVNMKEDCLLGSVHKYCKWGLTFLDYLNNKYNSDLPLIKVFSGR